MVCNEMEQNFSVHIMKKNWQGKLCIEKLKEILEVNFLKRFFNINFIYKLYITFK